MLLTPNKDRRLHVVLWFVVAAALVWSYIGCYDRFTWLLEIFPVIIGTIVLLALYPYFRFSRLIAVLLCLHAIVLMIGGHYSYARVPFFDWIRVVFHFSRNHYDRLGHFTQGFVPALIAREVLLRRGVVKRGRWLVFIVLCIALAISATYELFEAGTAILGGAKADDFLGTQGDPWDTQWDMTWALIGATTAMLTLRPLQDREIIRVESFPK